MQIYKGRETVRDSCSMIATCLRDALPVLYVADANVLLFGDPPLGITNKGH